NLFFHAEGAGAAGRALDAVAKLAYIDLQFSDSAAERVAVHAEFAGGSALVALVLLTHGQDEAFLDLAHTLGIKNIAAVHLQDQRFQLIFHDGSLSSMNFSLHRSLFRRGSWGAR